LRTSEPVLVLVDQHRKNDDYADHDEFPERIDVDEYEPEFDHGDDERADQRADDIARAAKETRAADHNRRDRIEQHGLACVCRAGGEACRVDDAAYRGEGRRDEIDREQMAAHVDARAHRRLRIAASRIGILIKSGLREHEMHDDEQ